MQMKCEQVINFFREFGFVTTLRNYPYKKGQKVLINRTHKAMVAAVFPATQENIELFAKFSSFKSSEEWIQKAKALNQGRLPKYLVLVVRREK
ncbi:MAG: hypothetical protein J7L47_05630 [Candidatus Odinarchaeota archaeon]|nr:hypothetical protein [Candidatus Odinarchaeota archaeon]